MYCQPILLCRIECRRRDEFGQPALQIGEDLDQIASVIAKQISNPVSRQGSGEHLQQR